MIESIDDNEKNEMKKNYDSNTPALDNFSRDLTKLAQEGKLDPVVGRESEVIRIAQILSRRKKNNPIILGEPGCVLAETIIEVEKISDENFHKIITM